MPPRQVLRKMIRSHVHVLGFSAILAVVLLKPDLRTLLKTPPPPVVDDLNITMLLMIIA